MADRRLFNKKVLMSTEFLFELSVEAKNLYLAIGLNTDTYGFVVNYERLMEETRAGVKDMQELINHKFVYLIDKDTLVDLKFQINNMIAPSQQNEPIYPQGLKHVYMDIDCQYHWSSTKIRKVVGYVKGSKDNNKRNNLFLDDERTEDEKIKEVDTTQQKASDFLGLTPAKEVKQAPSIENTATVQAQPEEVAPVQSTKQGNKVQDELKRLDDEQEQDNDFATKMKEAYRKGQEKGKQVNPYTATEEGKQEAEELSKQYATAGVQTRSLDDVEEPQPQYKDVGLTAEQQREFRDNPPEEDDSLPF